ncbi:MAG TPA: DUF6152 family protein [Gammaproteobacteria bacterium]|nr:DUF6152 family protein [Gammaproteobacteria bacterium]
MMSLRSFCGLAASALAVLALPAGGHHSHGNYDLTNYLTMDGTVAEIHWINPHTWIYMEVANPDGTTTLWTLEGGSINALTQRGWSRDSVQVGDAISVRCHPLRTGTPSCLFGYLKTADGEEKEYD